MKRFFITVLVFALSFLLSACKDKYRTVEDFYNEMKNIKLSLGDSRIYDVSVYENGNVKEYKVYTKKNKTRIETVDEESYSNFSNLVIDNEDGFFSYNPFSRRVKQVFEEQEKRNLNPMLFLINWGRNDAGYLNYNYVFGRNTKIQNMPCKVIRNIDQVTKKENFSYCISTEFGVAIYLRVPCVADNNKNNKECETVTWVTKIEENDIPDYLFNVPSDAIFEK